MAKFLDEVGLDHLWNKIKELVEQNSGGSGGSSKWEYLESADIVGGNSIDLSVYHDWNELLIMIHNANGVQNDQACIGTDNLDFLFDITTAGNQMWIRAEKDNQGVYLLTVGGMVVGNYHWYDGDELTSIYVTSNTTTQNDPSIEIGVTIYGR